MEILKAKLICWSTDQTDPTLSKNKKTILLNFGQLGQHMLDICHMT